MQELSSDLVALVDNVFRRPTVAAVAELMGALELVIAPEPAVTAATTSEPEPEPAETQIPG